MIDFIEECVAKASRHESKMTTEALDIPSYTGIKIRHLLNNLGEMPDSNYLEIGVHKGGTFVAANFKNSMNAFAVDNWSNFAENGESRRQFISNTSSFLGKFSLLEKDCWTLTNEDLPVPINFYFYDGHHSEECQEMALTKIYSLLADQFLLLVDDYYWSAVKTGTLRGLHKAGLKVVYQKELFTPEAAPPQDHWWNGLYVAILKKTHKLFL